MTSLTGRLNFMTGCSGADKIAGVCMLGAFLPDCVPRVYYTSFTPPRHVSHGYRISMTPALT